MDYNTIDYGLTKQITISTLEDKPRKSKNMGYYMAISLHF